MTSKIEGEGGLGKGEPLEAKFPVDQGTIVPTRETAAQSHAIPPVKEMQSGAALPQAVTVGAVDVLDEDALRKTQQELLHAAAELEKMIPILEGLPPPDGPSVEAWSKENSLKLLEVAKTRAKASENWGEFSEGMMSLPDAGLELVVRYVEYPLEQIISPLSGEQVQALSEKIGSGILNAELAFAVPDTLGKVAALIYKRTALKYVRLQAEQLAKGAASGDPELKLQLAKLNAWIEIQDNLLTKEALALGVGTLAYTPTMLKTIFMDLDHLTDAIKYGDLWVAAVTSVIVNSYQVYTAEKERTLQTEWSARFREEPVAPEALVLEAGQTTVPANVSKAVSRLLEKRESALVAKMTRDSEAFEEWLALLQKDDMSIEAVEQLCKEKGVSLDKVQKDFLLASLKSEAASALLEENGIQLRILREFDDAAQIVAFISERGLASALERCGISLREYGKIASQQGFKEALANPLFKDELHRAYTEHKQTITTLTRQGLKSLEVKKHSVERKFLNFRLAKASISLTASTLAFIALIVLKTLALAAVIAVPSIALASTGVGLFVLGIALLAAGLILLYRVKPNLFKTFFRGVQLRMALYNIPASFQSFRYNLNKIDQLKKGIALQEFRAQASQLRGILEASETVEAKSLPKELRPLLKRLKIRAEETLKQERLSGAMEKLEEFEREETNRFQQELEELDRKVTALKESVEHWKNKIRPLRQQVIEAGWKDFQIQSRQAKEHQLTLEEVLVEGIFVDGSLLDEETEKVLEQQLGLDLEGLRKGKALDVVKDEVKEALKTFFAMDDRKLVQFIRQQEAKFKHGVYE